jgi:hypothetical protein
MKIVLPSHRSQSTYPPTSLKDRCAGGFALISAILIMALLVMIALGMLSLSSVEVRSSQNDRAMAEAQANARMALMIAIGELQKNAGSDTRITASSNIIDEDSPPLLGVWRSWEGSDHESNGRPIAPNYAVKRQSADAGGRFLSWLVSGAKLGEHLSDPASLVYLTQTGDSVPLLSDGTLGEDDTRQIHLSPQSLDANSGKFAWWISGENQKARLTQPHSPRANGLAGLAEAGQSHTVPNPEAFGLASLLEDPEPHNPNTAAAKSARKVASRKTMTLIGDDNSVVPEKKFHDFSSNAVGLLTNSATGGWRKDISVLSEKWDSIYTRYAGGKLPLFRYSPDPGATSQVPKPTTSDYDAEQSNLYPWSEYSTILGYKQPGTYHAASASWASLQSFATSYKNFTYSAGNVTSPFVWDKIAKSRASSITSSEIYNHKHRQGLHPQIARFQFLVYARAEEDPNRLNQNPKRYALNLMYVPYFTLWNPYNVSLEHEISGTLNAGQGSGKHTNFLGVGWRRSAPGAMAIVNQTSYPDPDLVPSNQYRMLSNGNFQTLDWPSNYANQYDHQLAGNVAKYGGGSIWKDLRTWACWLPEGTLTFKPGEAKMFSPEWIDNGYGFGGGVFRMREGYNPTSIVGRDFRIFDNLTADRSYWFLFRNDRLTQPYRDRAPGNGFSLSFGDGSSHFGGTAIMPSGLQDEFHNITALVNDDEGDKYWPTDEVDEVGYSVAELASGPWIPLFSVSFGPRMTIGTGTGTGQNRPTKGVVQNDALAAMVLSDPASGHAKDHPANNTFDFAYHSLSMGSTVTPNLSDSEGYIGTGYQSGDGLSRLILADIPLRPMASLVELQGWNPRGHNPYPPFQMNLIGNSDATPLIPKNDIVPPTLAPNSVEFNLQHDDAYCANHLLFDDWFVSSIAPQPTAFGSGGKDIETFYQDYLQGNDQLSNRAYTPIAEDLGLASSAAAERVLETLQSPDGDGWLKVASRLEVEGMFNVNSTSVEAWRALLGHAKSREQIAMHGENGIQSVTPSNDHTVSRGAIASDVEAGSGAAIGGKASNASEYLGFRSLKDEQIEDLAEKIVEQVRLRGPFLSLSEFVNRQLSSNTELALAGAIQTALNNLTDDPMAHLSDPQNNLSDTTMLESDAKLGGVGYAFPESAEGDSAYGAPGWIRQADILRPIAPVLSVRDDTFTIRAYGDSRDANGKVLSRAWCEAVVKRTRDFCEGADAADSTEPPTNETNVKFGRRFSIISFKWLNAKEV